MTEGVIGVVVVNFRSAELIEHALGSVHPPSCVVVVVDNFSTASERGAVAAMAERHGWAAVMMPGNRGFGAGVNAGVARAQELGATCFLLLNPDAVVTEETVVELRRAVLDQPGALVSPRLVDHGGGLTFAGSLLDRRSGRVRSARGGSRDTEDQVLWLTAAAMALHSELWQSAGGFDESYFMYWEDVDFSERCRRVGAELVVRDDLKVIHDQGGTQGPRRGRAKSSLYYYYNARNRMMFAAKWLAPRDLRRWLWVTPAVTVEIFLRGGRRQIVESPGRVWAIVRGGCAATLVGVIALLKARRQERR